MMRRRALPWLLVLCSMLFVDATMAQAAGAEPIGIALHLPKPPPAEVKYGPDGAVETEYKDLEEHTQIVERTRVVTAKKPGTEIQLGFPPGKHGIVKLGPVTKFTFEKWLAEAAGGEYSLRLYVGQVIALFWPDTGEHTVTINIPTGWVKLHGTAVFLDVSPIDGSTFVYVQEGSATVKSLAGGEVTVQAGQQASVAPGQPPTEPVSVSPGAGPELRPAPDIWIFDPPLIDLDDPRLNLPK